MADSIKFDNNELKFTDMSGFDNYCGFQFPTGGVDTISFTNADWYGRDFDFKEDKVNSPKHYTKGKQEVIDTIEDAIEDAPNMKVAFLQGQVLKYLFRLWLKDNPKEDAEKARWYLTRLIDSL